MPLVKSAGDEVEIMRQAMRFSLRKLRRLWDGTRRLGNQVQEQAEEGSAAPHLPRRDNPPRALQRLHKREKNSLITMLPSDMQMEIMDRLGKDSLAHLRLTCWDFE